MEGLMMRTPLLVRHIAERAATVFGGREVVSRTQEGVERTTYAELVERARRLASALRELGVGPGDRVATFAWNSARHLELYLAVPGLGAVLHTLNIRLFEDDLRYIAGHAGDRVVFLDASLAGAMPRFEGVEHEVLMPDGPGEREGGLGYEDLVDSGDPGFAFPDLDEDSAAAMCYTSGTTGRPKGVVYSHRSTVLHSLCVNQPPGLPRPPHGAGQPGSADRGGAGDALRGRAHDLAGGARARGPARDARAGRGHVRRLGGARGADPRLRRALRGPRRPGLGDDRDQPAGG
ncbi:MAG: long-chain fatty acid--CoA ligase [Actinobacteria bacterium]|nr:MAG: long-chain fatty acid--CoA ligase [Actinomycetota bacterium]